MGKSCGISQIRVFGSVARGTATEKSDVDLLVHVEAGRSLLDMIRFEQGLGDLIGVRVEIVTERALHPQLESEILREAVLL